MKHLGKIVLLAVAPLACAAPGQGDGGAQPASFGPANVPQEVAPHVNGSILVYPPLGNPTGDEINPLGPALVLMGGARPVVSAFAWAEQTIGLGRAAAGDLVILRATGDDSLSNVAFQAGGFNSVRTIVIPADAPPEDLVDAAAYLTEVEAILFADDDALPLVKWASSPLMTAVGNVFLRGGVILGLGESATAFGQFALDPLSPGAGDVVSTGAVANPFEPSIAFTEVFRFPELGNLIVDTHFTSLDRLGRLTAFMARQVAAGTLSTDPPLVLGVGIDDGNAIAVDRFGQATLLQDPGAQGGGFVLVGGAPAAGRIGDAARLRRHRRDPPRHRGRDLQPRAVVRDRVHVRGLDRWGQREPVHTGESVHGRRDVVALRLNQRASWRHSRIVLADSAEALDAPAIAVDA